MVFAIIFTLNNALVFLASFKVVKVTTGNIKVPTCALKFFIKA